MSTYDKICEAQEKLKEVRSAMIDAMLESESEELLITSADFAPLNALEEHLASLAEIHAPTFEPFAFSALLKASEARVKGREGVN